MNHGNRHGFTIIELMLAMSFVSVLFIGIAMITIQVGQTYNRGLTMKSVNQAGRDVSDVLKRDIAASQHSSIVFVTHTSSGAQGLNRLCLGNYTYLWSYGKSIYDGNAKTYQGTTDPIVLARINDADGAYCKPVGGAYPASVPQADAIAVLKNDSLQLALHSFTIAPVIIDEASNQAAYTVQFTIGTNDQEAIVTGNQQCRPPDDVGGNLQFCAINNFEMIVRAGGAL